MKELVNVIFGVFVVFAFGQDNPLTGAPTNNIGLNAADEASLIANAWDISKISGVFYEFDDIRFGKVPTDGSFLLFDKWDNRGVIVLGGEKLVVNNINYHVDEEKFISELDNDSTFVFDFKGIERIIVNSRPFISMYSSAEGKNKVYEVVVEGNKISLVKNYYSNVTQGSTNPMLNRARNKIQLRSNYFVLKNGGLLPFNAKKSGFKKFLNPQDAAAVDQFVKEKKLSYRKEKDLKEIFNYLNTL